MTGQRGRPDREDCVIVAILICIISVFWFSYAYQTCSPALNQCMWEGIKEWQTLIAGILATGAAAITVLQVGRQIRQNESALRHQRQRRASSHRAMLPLILSDICDFIETDNIKLKVAISTRTMPDQLEWPESLSVQFETLREVWEFDDENQMHANNIRILISQIQVYRSRRRPKNFRSVAKLEGLDRLRDAAEIYVSASALFDYARGEHHRRKSQRDDFFQTIRTLGYWDGIDAEVYEYFEILYPPQMPSTSSQ
jgi:hypothetical protein